MNSTPHTADGIPVSSLEIELLVNQDSRRTVSDDLDELVEDLRKIEFEGKGARP